MSAALSLLKRCALDVFGPACAKCKRVSAKPQLDHIYPRSVWDGRELDPHNVQILCPDCNRLKGTTVVDYRGAHQYDLANALRKRYITALGKELDDKHHALELLIRATSTRRKS